MERREWMRCGLAVVGLVGCGGGDGDDDATPPSPDAGPIATSVALEARTSDNLAVLAYRDEGGIWQDLPPADDDKYTLRVHGAYEVIAVCGDAGTYQTEIILGTPADGPQRMFCFSSGTPPTPQVTRVTGTMAQPGAVTFNGLGDESMTGPWTFEIDAPSGQPGDLFAFDADRVVLRRGLDLATPIADLDLATGSALVKTPVIVDGRELDDVLSTETYAFTENGSIMLRRTGTTVTTLPAALLDVYDFQFSYISAGTPTTQRGHAIENETRVELLPRLEGITFAGNSASWSTLPAAGDKLTLSLWGTAGSVGVSATKGWFAGRTTLAVPADLPSNLPAGAIPSEPSRNLSLSANYGERSSRVYENAISSRQISGGEHHRPAALVKAKLRD